MSKEDLRNHFWVAKTALTDAIPFAAFFVRNRNGDPLYLFGYEEPVEFHNVGYYGNTLWGVATSESMKKMSIMFDGLVVFIFALGVAFENLPQDKQLGIAAMVFGALTFIWSKAELMGKVRRDFHTDFEHEKYPYVKKKRKGKRKRIGNEIVEVMEDEY